MLRHSTSVNSFPLNSNRPSRTVVRGPGDIEASYIIESVVERIAHHLGLDPVVVRETNFYSDRPEDEEKLVAPNGAVEM